MALTVGRVTKPERRWGCRSGTPMSYYICRCVNCAGTALQCYQCDSNEDASCPSWQPFDHNINALVDCMSFEASTPGTFCLKITRQSPGCMFNCSFYLLVTVSLVSGHLSNPLNVLLLLSSRGTVIQL